MGLFFEKEDQENIDQKNRMRIWHKEHIGFSYCFWRHIGHQTVTIQNLSGSLIHWVEISNDSIQSWWTGNSYVFFDSNSQFILSGIANDSLCFFKYWWFLCDIIILFILVLLDSCPCLMVKKDISFAKITYYITSHHI